MVDIEKVKQHLEAAKAEIVGYCRFVNNTTPSLYSSLSNLDAALALLTPEAVKLEWV